MSEQQFHDCLKHAARRQADSSFFVTGLQTSIRNFSVCVCVCVCLCVCVCERIPALNQLEGSCIQGFRGLQVRLKLRRNSFGKRCCGWGLNDSEA